MKKGLHFLAVIASLSLVSSGFSQTNQNPNFDDLVGEPHRAPTIVREAVTGRSIELIPRKANQSAKDYYMQDGVYPSARLLARSTGIALGTFASRILKRGVPGMAGLSLLGGIAAELLTKGNVDWGHLVASQAGAIVVAAALSAVLGPMGPIALALSSAAGSLIAESVYNSLFPRNDRRASGRP